MDTHNDTENRIITTANRLFEEAGRERFPTVDAVRRAARADMNTTTLVMKQWRRQQTAQPEAVRSNVPDSLRASWLQQNETALNELWEQAQTLANESLETAQSAWEQERREADEMRAELSAAYELQAGELERVTTELNDASDRASVAEREVASLQSRVDDAERNSASLKESNNALDAKVSDLHKHIEQLIKEHSDALSTEREERVAAQNKAVSLEKEVGSLKSKVEDLQSELSTTQQEKTKYATAATEREKQIADIKSDISTLKKEYKEEISSIKKEHEKLLVDQKEGFESRLKEKDVALNKLEAKVSDAEKMLFDEMEKSQKQGSKEEQPGLFGEGSS